MINLIMDNISKENYMDFVKSLLPKNHTQALEFIQSNPNYDGRTVKVAIWDTGVDPAAEGLQITTEGKPKLTYMCDTSESGHVLMDIEVNHNSDTLKLMSEKEIQVPKSWNLNDNHKLKLGLKTASEIFPSGLISRISKDYKENLWTKEMNRLLLQFNEIKRSSTDQPKKLTEMEPAMLLECLDIIDKAYEYPVPVFDCVVFHNGEDYVSFVDITPLNPDLSIEEIPLLKSFHNGRQYSNFGGKTNLNFGVNIWNDGKLLEIVTSSGSHGTHVASIATGYFPNNPECNGIAPGAEVVSIKISDTRLGSMETGIALALAAQRTIDLKCDIVNLSFGEASVQPNCGKVCKIMKELVTKYGIVFCSSSGNSGPALSTVGSPGGTTDGLFGISPMVFPDMIESNYSLLTNPELPQVPQVYTWASRGPTTDGALGIHVAAPGAAITSVGNWQNRNIGLMNGSSMSSPNACGGITLLISAARQNNKCLSPWIISVATANTAKVIENVSRLSQGFGLLQVKNAYDYMTNYWEITECLLTNDGDSVKKSELEVDKKYLSDSDPRESRDPPSTQLSVYSKSDIQISEDKSSLTIPLNKFRIKCSLINGNRGIHLREPLETNKPRQIYISVAPDFDEMNIDTKHQPNVKMYLTLNCKASWVECPRFFTLYNQERTIGIKLDPTQLNRNLPEFDSAESNIFDDSNSGIYFTEIEFFCLDYANIGPLARLPITVYIPEKIDTLQYSGKVSFEPNRKIVRQFIATPTGSNALSLQVNPISVVEGSSRFELRLMSIQPNISTISSELGRSLVLDKKLDISISDHIGYGFNSTTSCTIEMTLAQYWSALNPAEVEFHMDFHGLTTSSTDIRMLSSDHYIKLLLESNLRTEEVAPFITINYLVCPVRPFKEETTYIQQPICESKEIINLNLFYSFNNPKVGEVGVFCPALGNLLYENDFFSQMYQIYDSNNRVVGTGDYKPEIYFFRLEKGDFKVRLQVKHSKMSQIEKLKEQCVQIYFKTFPTLNFEYARSLIDINCNRCQPSSKINFSLSKGEKTSLFITSNILKVLKQFNSGSYLTGTLSLYKQEALKKAVAYPFQFIFTSNVNNEKNKNSDGNINYKLNSKLCNIISGFMNGEIKHDLKDSVNSDEEISQTNMIVDQESQKSDIAGKIERLSLKSESNNSLTKYLLSCISDLQDASIRKDVNDIMEFVGGDKDLVEIKFYNLRAANKFIKDYQSRWKTIESLSELLIEMWDTKELAEYCGTKFTDPSISLSKDQKLKLDKVKSNLIEVLCIYGISLCERAISQTHSNDESANNNTNDKVSCDISDTLKDNVTTRLDFVYSKICRFVSPWDNNATCLSFFVIHAYAINCRGRLLKLLLKSYEDQPNLDILKLIQEVLISMNWSIFGKHYKNLRLIKHPITNNFNRDM